MFVTGGQCWLRDQLCCHRSCTQQVLSRIWDEVNVHIDAVQRDTIPWLLMEIQGMPLWGLRARKLGQEPDCGKNSLSFRKWLERLFPRASTSCGDGHLKLLWRASPQAAALAVSQCSMTLGLLQPTERFCSCRWRRTMWSPAFLGSSKVPIKMPAVLLCTSSKAKPSGQVTFSSGNFYNWEYEGESTFWDRAWWVQLIQKVQRNK